MKFSLFKNDKTTVKDELILIFMVLISLAVGITLCILKPSVWIIDSNMFVSFGVMCIMFAVMFIPCIIYRLITNE